MLSAKMNTIGFEFFQKAFGLPHITTLMVNLCADLSSPDGLVMESIAQASRMMDGLGMDDDDFQREDSSPGTWDSHHTIHDKFSYDHNIKILLLGILLTCLISTPLSSSSRRYRV